jgi:hypothetical protein
LIFFVGGGVGIVVVGATLGTTAGIVVGEAGAGAAGDGAGTVVVVVVGDGGGQFVGAVIPPELEAS